MRRLCESPALKPIGSDHWLPHHFLLRRNNWDQLEKLVSLMAHGKTYGGITTMVVGSTTKRVKPLKRAPQRKTSVKQNPVKSTARRKTVPQQIIAKRLSTRNVAFPSKPSKSKYPSTMSESQKKRASGRSSHRERVLMRAILRKSGTIARDAPNEVGDKWLQSHGYLHGKGYQPPANRVSKLSKAVGFKRRPTPRQLGIT